MHDGPPRRILALCLPGIGDAILFTPALAMLRTAFPQARITAVTMFAGAADLLRANPDVDEVRQFDFFHERAWAALRFLWTLRRERFDLSILGFPANRLEYNVVNALLGRRWRAGHRYRTQRHRNLALLNNILVPEQDGRHNVEHNLDLVRAVCDRVGVACPPTSRRLRVHLTPDDEARAAALLAEHGIGDDEPLIGCHTYSSTFKNMHRKCWDKDRFVALIDRIGDAYPAARVLLFSGPSDVAVNRHILVRARGRVTPIEAPNIRWALGVLRRCRAFVSNDSAIMHLAGALGVPVVAIFGPTDPLRLHPWEGPHRIVRRTLPCMPCFPYSSRPLRCAAGTDYACLRELDVDDVFSAVADVLAADAPAGATA
jgi:heptosyltransferase-2